MEELFFLLGVVGVLPEGVLLQDANVVELPAEPLEKMVPTKDEVVRASPSKPPAGVPELYWNLQWPCFDEGRTARHAVLVDLDAVRAGELEETSEIGRPVLMACREGVWESEHPRWQGR